MWNDVCFTHAKIMLIMLTTKSMQWSAEYNRYTCLPICFIYTTIGTVTVKKGGCSVILYLGWAWSNCCHWFFCSVNICKYPLSGRVRSFHMEHPLITCKNAKVRSIETSVSPQQPTPTSSVLSTILHQPTQTHLINKLKTTHNHNTYFLNSIPKF